jgi:hypothetical protein
MMSDKVEKQINKKKSLWDTLKLNLIEVGETICEHFGIMSSLEIDERDFIRFLKPRSFEPVYTKNICQRRINHGIMYERIFAIENNLPQNLNPAAITPVHDGPEEILSVYKTILENDTNDEIYGYLAKEAIRNFPKYDKEYEPNITLVWGPPGTGKTRFIFGIPDLRESMVVVATRKQKEEYERQNITAYTPHVAMTIEKEFKNKHLIIDECFSLPAGLLVYLCMKHKFETVLLAGDPMQINYIDFKTNTYDKEQNMMNVHKFWNFHLNYLDTTHRCPQDITNLLLDMYPGWRTTSNVVESIFQPEEYQSVGQTIVFTQAAKKLYPGSITVHESQGSTFRDVTLVLTSDCGELIARSLQHYVVAITRHTDRLFICGDHKMKEVFLSAPDRLLHNLEAVGIHMFDFNKPDGEIARTVEVGETELLQRENLAVEDVADIIDNVACGTPNDCVVAITPTDLPQNQELLQMNMSAVIPKSKIQKIKAKTMSVRKYTTYQPSNSATYAAKTMIARYLTDKSNESIASATEYTNKLTAAFEKAIFKYEKFTEQEFNDAIIETFESFHEKNRLKDFKNIADFTRYITEFNTKKQQKYKESDLYKFTEKPGQGISAWPQTLNAMCCVYMRAVEKAIRRSLKDHIIWANGSPDNKFYHEYLDNIQDKIRNNNFNYKCVENDFGQFDASQSKATVDFVQKVYVRCGLPQLISDIMKNWRASWTLKDRNGITGFGSGKKHSGAPDTLLENTILNIALNHLVFDFKGVAVLAFKGDDFMGVAKNIKINKEVVEYLATKALTNKIKITSIPKFIGYFYHPNGSGPDVTKLVAKMISRYISDQNEFEQYQDAIKDWIRDIRDERNWVALKQITIKHYSEEGIALTDAQLDLCLGLLQGFSKIDYDTFCKISKETEVYLIPEAEFATYFAAEWIATRDFRKLQQNQGNLKISGTQDLRPLPNNPVGGMNTPDICHQLIMGTLSS